MTFLAAARSRRLFSIFACWVLAYNLPVILWGAYVRISFSGDGCGANWPTCKGQLIPGGMATPTAIEFTHRFMTSLDTIAVLALLAWAFLAYPKRHPVRRYSLLSLIFLLVEALLGAGLVLFRYVAKDKSAGRVWYLSAHLTNTMLLLAALVITAWLAYTRTERLDWRETPPSLVGALAVTIVVSITGTIAALGDTLFPASSLAAGIQQDFSKTSSTLLRLRVWHPAIALAGAVYLVGIAARLLRESRPLARISKAAIALICTAILQVGVGMLNLVLLAPLPMQILHLLMADLVWIAVVALTLAAIVDKKVRETRAWQIAPSSVHEQRHEELNRLRSMNNPGGHAG